MKPIAFDEKYAFQMLNRLKDEYTSLDQFDSKRSVLRKKIEHWESLLGGYSYSPIVMDLQILECPTGGDKIKKV